MSSYTLQIYSGRGADPICTEALRREIEREVDNNKYAVQLFNKNTKSIKSQNTAAVFIPGGDAYGMLNEMKLVANEIDYVVSNQGASFYGSCAGAIVCSQTFHCFRGGKRDSSVNFSTSSGINFNNLITSAPYYTKKPCSPFVPEAAYNLTSVEVEFESNFLSTCRKVGRFFHAFGPCFTNIPDHYGTLATYRTEGNVSSTSPIAAAVTYPYPEHYSGYVSDPLLILTGIHPEIGLIDLEKPDMQKALTCNGNNQPYKDLLRELGPSEEIRHEMFRVFLENMNLTLKSKI